MKFLKIIKIQGTDRGSRISPLMIAVDSIEKIEELYPQHEKPYAKITLKGRSDYYLASSVNDVLDALHAFMLPAGSPEIVLVKGDA